MEIEMFQTVLTRFPNALNIPALQKNMPKLYSLLVFSCYVSEIKMPGNVVLQILELHKR